jgi:hypothetical protein
MRDPRRRVGARLYAPGMQFIAILIVAALWAKWGWILILAIAAIWMGCRIVKEFRRAHAAYRAVIDAENDRLDGLRRRADQQHNWRMQGDPRGTYGESAAT